MKHTKDTKGTKFLFSFQDKPFVFDPFDPATLYAAADQIYKSTDYGDNWNTLSGPLSSEPMRILEIAPSAAHCIYVSDGSRLFKSTDSGNNWSELDTDEFPTFITGIAVHPHNQKILWLTIGGYGRWNSRFTWLGSQSFESQHCKLPGLPGFREFPDAVGGNRCQYLFLLAPGDGYRNLPLYPVSSEW